MRSHSAHTLVLVFLVLAPAAGFAQEPIPLTRIEGPIALDGRLDEPVWHQLEPLDMTVYSPTFGGPASERTEIMVAYDDVYLYVGGRFYDSDPKGIRTNTLYRDQYSGDDVFSVILDTYNDYESGLWFSTSPGAVRSDRTVSNDAELGFGSMNQDWNTFWDVATTQTDQGWFAEMRIPFTSLSFEDQNGDVVMGMIVYRFIARKNERHLYPAIPPDWGMGFAKPSQSQRVSLEGVYRRKPVYVTPYVLGGVSQAAELNQTGTAFGRVNDRTGEIGGDLKYSVTSNLTLDATVNTDFAQVEADDQQVNLTRFSLFFPEKRQFFQERSSIFEFNTGGVSRLFHSRRIGLSEDSEPTRILGGLRTVGRIGGTDLGVLTMQTAAQDGFPSEHFGVARLRRQVFNPYSNIGAMFTSRATTEGDLAVSTGVDGVVRVIGDEYVTAKWASSFDNIGPGSNGGLADASRFILNWERRRETGLSYSADYVRSGREYDPRLGFALRSDFTQLEGELQYRRFASPESAVNTITVRGNGVTYLRNNDRTAESALIKPEVEIEMKTGAQITLGFDNTYEGVRQTFELSDAVPVPPGDYWFHEGRVKLMLPRGGLFRGESTVSAGSFYDGWRFGVAADPTWNPSRHLELAINYSLNVLRFSDRDASLDAHLLRLKVQTALDVHFSASTFVQYSNTADRVSVNARLRYNFAEGNDLWLVYNDAVNTDRDLLAVPRPLVSEARALLLKYTYTFVN